MNRLTDLWGVAIPAWIGAIGGVISSIVGAIALILSLRNQAGVKTLAAASNQSTTGTLALSGTAHEFVTWGIERDGQNYKLINRSGTHEAYVLRLEDVSPDSDGAFQPLQDLPIPIAPGGSIPFIIQKTLVSAAVTAIQIDWAEEDRDLQSNTLFV